ncbi:MAG TPA: tRNA lysidine(34) synthetase TilS [Vicinamibacterales bacterium]
MDLLARIRRYLERERLAAAGARVLAAVSGGADSVAMLLLLRELAAGGGLQIAGVAHLNHQLRGQDSDDDERFSAALAERYDLPFRSARVDVAAAAREEKRSLEDMARTARYAFLKDAAVSVHADVIAVAHTRDDQAETFLLRLVRGAGARGLGGIRPRCGTVIRPLLDVTRRELREYLSARHGTFREDASNADVAIPRNRIRHELLPYLEGRFAPGIVDILAREATLAQADERYLRSAADALGASVLSTDEAGFLRIDAAMLVGAPPALSMRVALAALERAAGKRPITYDHVRRLLEFAAASNTSISLPGQQVTRVGAAIVLAPDVGSTGSRASRLASGTPFAFSLSIPGEVQLAGQRLAVGAEKLPEAVARLRKWTVRDSEVGVAADPLDLPLAVRSRRPGDRFRPLGAPGIRKLQDFLVDRKVPRTQRDTLPLVVDATDRIVWVVGHSVAEDFRVTDPSRGVILLKVRRLGGSG